MRWKTASPEVKRSSQYASPKKLKSSQPLYYKDDQRPYQDPYRMAGYVSDQESIESIMRKFAELEGNVDINYQNRDRHAYYNNGRHEGNNTDFEYEKENTLDYRRSPDYYRNAKSHEKDYDYDFAQSYNYNNIFKDHNDKYRTNIDDSIDSRYPMQARSQFYDVDRSKSVTYDPSNYEAYLEDSDGEEDLYFSKNKKIQRKSSMADNPEDVWIENQIQDHSYNNYTSSESEYEEYEYEFDEADEDYHGKNERVRNLPKKITNLKTFNKNNKDKDKIKVKGYNPKEVDIDEATHLKLPPLPIPTTWASIIHNPLHLELQQTITDGSCTTEIVVKNVKDNVEDIIRDIQDYPIQGILGRPPFSPDSFTISDWIVFMKSLLPRVMSFGYLFIWVEREEMADVIKAAERELSFKYVENLCWIKKTLSNRIIKAAPRISNAQYSGSGPFFNSKSTLLILRKDPDSRCKLRHQRNGDCIFDFIGPAGRVKTRWPDGKVYDVIETLLDGTRLKGPHLLHLWANNSPIDQLIHRNRHRWIRISETESE